MSKNEFENALDVKNKLEEFRKFMDETAERKIREFLESPYKDRLLSSFFERWAILLEHYVCSINRSRDLYDILDTVLLSILYEGFVKIVCFLEDPQLVLSKRKRERTLGKLSSDFISIIKKYERDGDKLSEIEELVDFFNKIRNEILHFPLYYELDYRLPWLFFQLVAYSLEKLDLWEYINEEVANIIKGLC